MKLSNLHKTMLKKKNISDKLIAKYTGYTRESINKILNGKQSVPIAKAQHLIQEFDELIDMDKEQIKKLK